MVFSSSEVVVSDCEFVGCQASSGAGILHISGALYVDGCTFRDCESQAIRRFSQTGSGPHLLEVRNSHFIGNRSSLPGGAIQAEATGEILIEGCTFEDQVTSGGGGAISLSGTGPKVVSGCVFRDIDVPSGSGGCIWVVHGESTISGNTMAFTHQVFSSGTAIAITSPRPHLITNNIFAFMSGAPAMKFLGGPVTSRCNVFWECTEGIGYTIHETDRIVDPRFCDEEARDLTLDGMSPCLPQHSLGCGLIGALGEGCGTIPVQPTTWSRIKSAFREGD
jgi:hypothetical protein